MIAIMAKRMKNIDLLDLLDQEDCADGDDSKLLEKFTGSNSESFDDHQQWMIDTFKETLR
jgi:hypothetical protein